MVKYPCGTCGKSATKDAIECNFCGLWHHAKPECMLEFSKDQITMLKELCKDRTCWTCNKCGIIMKKLNGRMADLEKSVTTVKADIKTVQTKQTETDKVVDEIKQEVKSLSGKVDNNCGNVKASVMAEVNNRELRKLNLIIYGLNEQTPDGAESREVTMERDRAALDKLLSRMNLEPSLVNESIKYRRRLGKREAGRTRPLLISFADIETRNAVVENVPELTSSDHRHVKIRPDLTQMQREDDSKLIKEVSDLNETKPKDELGDYRWRVVGPPGMLRKAKTRDLNKWKQAEQQRKAKHVVPKQRTPETASTSGANTVQTLSAISEKDEEEEETPAELEEHSE